MHRLLRAAPLLWALAGCRFEGGDSRATADEPVQPAPDAGIQIVSDAEIRPFGETEATEPELLLCSFNIQFLGHFPVKEDEQLATLMEPCDVVVVQELTGPPAAILDVDGAPVKEKERTKPFFAAMAGRGFEHVISPGKTGQTKGSTSLEMFVAFFKPARVRPATDLPSGFISTPLFQNPVFDRVPAAFSFRAVDQVTGEPTGADFVLVSVHLKARDDGENNTEFETGTLVGIRNEIRAIFDWVDLQQQTTPERDFIVLGDTNLEKREHIEAVIADREGKARITSLNRAGAPTNASKNNPRPYDQVFFDLDRTVEMVPAFGVVEITKRFNSDQFENAIQFSMRFSDHHMVYFRYRSASDDD